MLCRSVLMVAFVAFVSPAFGGQCKQPYAPDVTVTAASTKQDVIQLRDDVQAFVQASGVYQQCVVDASKYDSTAKSRVNNLLEASQHDKQRVADAFNAAIKAYDGKQATPMKTSDARN